MCPRSSFPLTHRLPTEAASSACWRRFTRKRSRMEQRITDTIRRYNTFLITAHIRVDGDALGSELALYHMLRGMGKTAIVYNQDETPSNYRFLPGAEQIVYE